MWKERIINLGELKAKTTNVFSFVYEGTILIDVATIEAGCGCTQVKWTASTNTLEVTYVPKNVPKELTNQGKNSYSTTRNITFKFKTKEEDKYQPEMLSFIAKIHKV